MRSLLIALAATLSLAACETWDRADSYSVQAKVVNKHSRRPGKVPRRYYVVIEYEGRQAHIRDREAYREKEVGDTYTACLVTYVERETRKTRTELERCPIHTQ